MDNIIGKFEGAIEPIAEVVKKVFGQINILGEGKDEGGKDEEENDKGTVEEFRNGNDNDLFFIIAILLLMLCIYKNKK